MEEKLYFKPASYGKGNKKKEKLDDSKNDYRIRNLVLFSLLIVVIVAVILWLLRGKTTTSGQFPENVKTESLTCVSTKLVPEKLNGATSSDREVKISAIFRGADDLKSISLVYTLNYASPDEAYGYEAKSHAEFNKALAASGYSVSKFSNKFSRYDNKLIISLSANNNEIDQISASYFMLNIGEKGELAKTITDYMQNYEMQGFACKSTTEK